MPAPLLSHRGAAPSGLAVPLPPASRGPLPAAPPRSLPRRSTRSSQALLLPPRLATTSRRPPAATVSPRLISCAASRPHLSHALSASHPQHHRPSSPSVPYAHSATQRRAPRPVPAPHARARTPRARGLRAVLQRHRCGTPINRPVTGGAAVTEVHFPPRDARPTPEPPLHRTAPTGRPSRPSRPLRPPPESRPTPPPTPPPTPRPTPRPARHS
jgi:hypothetical protein